LGDFFLKGKFDFLLAESIIDKRSWNNCKNKEIHEFKEQKVDIVPSRLLDCMQIIVGIGVCRSVDVHDEYHLA